MSAIARPLAAALVGLVAVLLLGQIAIPWLRRRRVTPGESASATLNRLHEHKRSTPTMGGLLVVAGILLAIALLADWRQPMTQTAVGILLGFAALGAIDDLLKCRAARRGLPAGWKLAGQVLIAAAGALWLEGMSASAAVPVIALTLWIVATSNAVNLTDGLDGLASGCVVVAATAVGVLASGLGPQLFAAAIAGSTLGFLFFNRRPARVFLGDTGALPLGALLAFAMINTISGWIVILVGGVFVAELSSVVLQVGWFKLSGQRLFRCAPLHHHFQFAGWREEQIVRRFWIAAGVCAALGICAGFAVGTGDGTSAASDSMATRKLSNQISAANLRITPVARSK